MVVLGVGVSVAEGVVLGVGVPVSVDVAVARLLPVALEEDVGAAVAVGSAVAPMDQVDTAELELVGAEEPDTVAELLELGDDDAVAAADPVQEPSCSSQS